MPNITRIVVDTNVISYVFKKDSRAEFYRKDLDNKQLIISFMTVAELKFWANYRNWGATRIAALEQHLRRMIIYPVDAKLIDKWAQITAQAEKAGKHIDSKDAWIAATALVLELSLVTHNRKHFESIADLQIISHQSATESK